MTFPKTSIKQPISFISAILTVTVFYTACVTADMNAYTDEDYVASLVQILGEQESTPGISEAQYVNSIITAIENPVAYSENDYIQSLVNAVNPEKVANSSSHRVKPFSSISFLRSY